MAGRVTLASGLAIIAFAIGITRLSAVTADTTTGANELGKVMILEYHLIEPQETRWGRSVENFRRDLQRLYDSGFRPIGMAEYIDGAIRLSAGTRPYILTFDDSSPGQFRYVVKNGKKEIDPDCAVGILMKFNKQHPDFALKGIFFVLPEAKEPHKLFGQPEFEAAKLRELAALGFEIGNHTQWHANLAKYDAQVVQKQLALAQEEIGKMVPGYKMRALALPFGVFPKNTQLAVQGSYKGASYHNEAILEVSGGPVPSPFSIHRDLLHLRRIQAGREVEQWIRYFEKHPDEVFVSDGKPEAVTFPASLQSQFNAQKFKALRVVTR